MNERLKRFMDNNPWIFEGLDMTGGNEMSAFFRKGDYRLYTNGQKYNTYLYPDYKSQDLAVIREDGVKPEGLYNEGYFLNPLYPPGKEQIMFNMLHPDHRFLHGEGIPEIIWE